MNIKEFAANVNKKIKHSFAKIREELEDHLNAINENTNEIQENYEAILDLDSKIDKLSERIEEMQMMLQQLPLPKTFTVKIQPLTINEKQVFKCLYAHEEPFSYSQIAVELNISESLAKTYVQNMIDKGIPIIIKYINAAPLISLDSEFKEVQAKENVVGIDNGSSEQVEND
ncbi:HTH domain-containing protein [Candidatus Woesearchaeota archaeon]|nr:HTH domain-containing protein [Candidatus Woesearchaeota archaeon]